MGYIFQWRGMKKSDDGENDDFFSFLWIVSLKMFDDV